ncbi:hypothetical protein OC835_005597 [Tilletia horrida]|nr:hypothetical protein OC835_005597 [Tilletia horrida]
MGVHCGQTPASGLPQLTQANSSSSSSSPVPIPPPASSAGSVASLEDDAFAPPIAAAPESLGTTPGASFVAAAFAGPSIAAATATGQRSANAAASPKLPLTTPVANTVVISGGSGFNDLVCATPRATFVMPISDDGGSSSEIIRVLGGPSIGDIRSRLVRLIPTSHQQYGLLPTDPRPPPSNNAVHALLSYRLPAEGSMRQIKEEWLAILEGRHRLWKGIEPERRECIRGFLVHFESEILRRAHRNFNFRGGSIGNFFLAAAQKFFRSVSSAIFLFSAITLTSTYRGSRVIPAINTNHTATIAASLLNGEVLVGQCEISHPSKPRRGAQPSLPPNAGPSVAARQSTIVDASSAAADAAAALASFHMSGTTSSPSPPSPLAGDAEAMFPMSRTNSYMGGPASADHTIPGTPSSAIFDPFSEVDRHDSSAASRLTSGYASARVVHSPALFGAETSSPASAGSAGTPAHSHLAHHQSHHHPPHPLRMFAHDVRTASTTSIVGNAGDGLDTEERSDDDEDDERAAHRGKSKLRSSSATRRRRLLRQQQNLSGSAEGHHTLDDHGNETATEAPRYGSDAHGGELDLRDDEDCDDEDEDNDDDDDADEFDEDEGEHGDDQFREAVGNILFAKDKGGESMNQPLPAPIERVFYVNAYRSEIFPRPSSDYLSVLGSARTLLYSCGSLWTSIIPCLALRNVASAIARSPTLTHKVMLLNTTHDRETDGMDALGFIRAVTETLNRCDVPPTSTSALSGRRRTASKYPPRSFITHIVFFPTGSIQVDRAAIEGLGITCVPVSAAGDQSKPRFTETNVQEALIACGVSS